MGNLKHFGGSVSGSSLPLNWHADQLKLQKLIIKRYNEFGIKYALPSFAGCIFS